MAKLDLEVRSKFYGKPATTPSPASPSTAPSSQAASTTSGGAGDVVELTNANFDELVLKSASPWMLDFYTTTCGNCKMVEPEWKAAAAKLNGKVKFGKVDLMAQKDLWYRFGLSGGLPFLRYFEAGSGKTIAQAKVYSGDKNSAAFVTFANTLVKA